MAAGIGVTQHPLGALVNSRNVASLSRTQMVLWTLALLPALGAMALLRMHRGDSDPLALTIPFELLGAMGISSASLVASPLILSTKTNQEPSPIATQRSGAALGQQPAEINNTRSGALYANPTPQDARFTDIFEGDEVGNAGHLDLAKIQMFFVTVVLLVIYVVNVMAVLRAEDWDGLPPLSEPLLGWLAISHAGYLGNKVVDHSESSPRAPSAAAADNTQAPKAPLLAAVAPLPDDGRAS